MSDQAKAGSATRLIRKVVFTYRLEGDPEEMERTLTVEHGGGGDAVDAVVLSEELIRKLGYVDAEGGCTPVKTTQGSDWKISAVEQDAADQPHCVWIHDMSCMWSEFCTNQ